MRVLRYVTTAADAGRAVRSVVPRRFSLGTHEFRRLKAQGAILVGGQSVHAGRILREGETIELRLPDAGDASPSPGQPSPSQLSPGQPSPALPPSFLRYRDDDLLIVSKGAPLPTLPSAHQRADTLRDQVAAMLGVSGEALRYHPVNRLDKGTSGLLCIALHAHAQRLLAAQLHTGGFVREYLAVTEGVPAQSEGVIDAPIARAGQGARRRVAEGGQHAVTRYRVERVAGGRALVRLRLETGRTHQIRVHLAFIGCPVAGDYLYGRPLAELPGRFALHSAALTLRQPITGETVSVVEPLPDALAALLSSASQR